MHVDNPIKHRHDKRLYAFSLSFDVGLNKNQAFKNQRSTDNSTVKFDPILGLTWRVDEYISLQHQSNSPELGYGTSNACFSPIDPAAEKPGQWVGQYHRQGKHRSGIPCWS